MDKVTENKLRDELFELVFGPKDILSLRVIDENNIQEENQNE